MGAGESLCWSLLHAGHAGGRTKRRNLLRKHLRHRCKLICNQSLNALTGVGCCCGRGGKLDYRSRCRRSERVRRQYLIQVPRKPGHRRVLLHHLAEGQLDAERLIQRLGGLGQEERVEAKLKKLMVILGGRRLDATELGEDVSNLRLQTFQSGCGLRGGRGHGGCLVGGGGFEVADCLDGGLVQGRFNPVQLALKGICRQQRPAWVSPQQRRRSIRVRRPPSTRRPRCSGLALPRQREASAGMPAP